MKFQALLSVLVITLLARSSIAATPVGDSLSERDALDQKVNLGLERRAGSNDHVTGTQVFPLCAVEQHFNPLYI